MKNPLSAEIVRTGNRRTIPGDVRRRKAASAQVYGEDGAQGKCEGQAAMKEEGSGQDKGRNDAQTSGNDMIRACGGDTRASSESDRLRTLLHHNGKTLVERDAIPGFTIMPPLVQSRGRRAQCRDGCRQMPPLVQSRGESTARRPAAGNLHVWCHASSALWPCENVFHVRTKRIRFSASVSAWPASQRTDAAASSLK